MKILKIYDPDMSDSSGVYEPSVNDKQVQLSNFLKTLDTTRVKVERFTLDKDPAAYVANTVVAEILENGGPDALPIVLFDDQLFCAGEYPSVSDLTAKLSTSATAVPPTNPCGCSCGRCNE